MVVIFCFGKPREVFSFKDICKYIVYTLLGSRLLFNVVILYTAAKRNPEFLGYTGKLFPGQLPPRPQEILPRRAKYPKDFHNDWKKIGSKRTKFDDLGLPLPLPKNKNILMRVEH